MSTLTKTAFEAAYTDNTTGAFADNTSQAITAGDMRQFADDIADSFQTVNGGETVYDTTVTTTSGGGTQVVATIPRTTNKTFIITVKAFSRWVSGGGGAAGDLSYFVLTGAYKDVSGTGTLVGAVSTIHSATSGAGVPTFSLAVSSTNLIVNAGCSSGYVDDVRVIAVVSEVS